MYVNKIDELIDKTIDNFYNDFKTNNLYKLLQKDQNIIKFQNEITQIIEKYASMIDIDELKVFINKDNIVNIVHVVKRYIAYYIFISFGYFYTGSKESFINNIIEYSRIQLDKPNIIKNFFNAENNSLIIKYYQLTKDIIHLINLSSLKGIDINKYLFAINFLNQFGMEYINKNLKTETGNNVHNIIKTIIFFELYNNNERQQVFQIIENVQYDKGEYMYIDIIVPSLNYIDYLTIEQSLAPEMRYNTSEIFSLLTELSEGEFNEHTLTPDDKIRKLINKQYIAPIVDDFLRYHKDTEKVDVYMTDKKDTKIKYIINKIETVSTYYSVDDNKDIKQLFYTPLSQRKAVTINDTEEIKIILKLHNQGTIAIKNNDYYNDLIQYRLYPYINFKDFQNDGFSIILNKTIDIIRYSTFEFGTKMMQMRCGSIGQVVNIVGLYFPSKNRNIYCQTLANSYNINSKLDNGFKLVQNFLKKYMLTDFKKSGYWIFNSKVDKINMQMYEQVNNLNKHDSMKMIVSKLYDYILSKMHKIIVNNIKDNYFYESFKYLRKIENKFMTVDRNSKMYNDILYQIYFKHYIKIHVGYDKNEDKLPTNVIKIPIIKTNKTISNVHKWTKLPITDNIICQHILSLQKINRGRKKDISKFNEDLFNFIEQFIIGTVGQDTICKSCGQLVIISNYVNNGSNTDDGKFVIYNMPLNILLSEIPKYSKLNILIQNVDKLIDRIASIINIPFYIGNDNKMLRQGLIKDIIDMVILHNVELKKLNYKQRHENSISTYGINKNLTNLFIFELENNIFNKEQSYYNDVKFNNLMIYICIYLIFELDMTQIINLNYDKTCNYEAFKKTGYKIFENMKIITNNKNELKLLSKYPILMFVIYYMAHTMSKYKIWKFDYDNTKNSQLLVMLTIINTLVDVLNSILEIDYSILKTDNYIYKLLITKLFIKLNTVFSDNTVLNKIQKTNNVQIVKLDKHAQIKLINKYLYKLTGKYLEDDYDLTYYTRCSNKIHKINSKTIYKLFNMSNLTNCITGQFHKWKIINKQWTCSICNENIIDIINKTSDINDVNIINMNRDILYTNIIDNYCLSNSKCIKSDNFGATYNNIKKEYLEMVQTEKLILNEIDKSIVQQLDNYTVNVITLTKNLKRGSNYVGSFIEVLQNIIGKNINIHNKNTYLEQNVYIINNDKIGNTLKVPIIVLDQHNAIKEIKNHTFFNMDVIAYINNNTGEQLFYNHATLLYIGYKDKNMSHICIKSTKYLFIEYSIQNKLLYMGYPTKYINIIDDKMKLGQIYNNNDLIIHKIVNTISQNRLSNLKTILNNINKIIYQLKFKYSNVGEIATIQNLINTYKQKVPTFKLIDNGEPIFKYWSSFLFITYKQPDIINFNIQDNYILIDNLLYHDSNGNAIMYYIISEFTKLLNYNTEKHIKINLIYLMIDIINYMYGTYNITKSNLDINKFSYILTAEYVAYDINTNGIYEEYLDETEVMEKQDEIYDDDERINALDIDTNMDENENADNDYGAELSMYQLD